MHAHEVTAITIAEYDRMAEACRRGTADHDVSQNIAALISRGGKPALPGSSFVRAAGGRTPRPRAAS